MLKGNKLVPGKNRILKDKIRTYKANGTEACQLEPQFYTDLVSQLLATLNLLDSPLNQCEMLCNDGTSKVRSGAPTFTMVTPHYDMRDRKQSLPVTVNILMTGDRVDPNRKSHLWAGKCVRDWSRPIYTHLVQMHMAQGLFKLAAMDAAITHRTLQILEMHSMAPHSVNGHFYYHTFAAAAATKLRTCLYMEIKVPGQFHICLTPVTGTANSDSTWPLTPCHVQKTMRGQKCCFSTSVFRAKQPRNMAQFSAVHLRQQGTCAGKCA